MSEPVRVVFDCNVFFQSLIAPRRPAGECLNAVRQGELELFVSHQIFDELRNVCLRPAIAARFRITEGRIDAFLLDLEKLGRYWTKFRTFSNLNGTRTTPTVWTLPSRRNRGSSSAGITICWHSTTPTIR